MEEENEGMTLGDIIHTVFSRKWIALITAAVILLAGTLGLYFGYNTLNSKYTCTFSVDLLGESGINSSWPDGSPFKYRELISRENLKLIKDSDESFKNIDVDGLYTQGDISITRNIAEADAEVTYTLTVLGKYFSSKAQAEQFLDAIAETPVNRINNYAVDQSMYLGQYDVLDFYEDRAGALSDQLGYLKSGLASMNFPSVGTLKSDSVKLMSQLEQFGRTLTYKTADMRSNHYVHNKDEALASYKILMDSAEREKARLQREYDLLIGQDASTGIVSTRIEELSAGIAKAEEEIELYKSYIGEDKTGADMVENAQFGTELSALKEELSGYTESYEQLLSGYYKSTSSVAYVNVTTEVGGMNIILCILISLLAGILVGAIVAFIVGYATQKKSESEATLSEESSSPSKKE